MRVRELIADLQRHDPESVVLRQDNSGGYEAIYGSHTEDATETATGKPVKAVVIGDGAADEPGNSY